MQVKTIVKAGSGCRRTWLAALILAMFLAPAVATMAQEALPADVAAAVRRLTRPLEEVPLLPIPNQPVETLIAAVNTHSASLGFQVDHGPAIRASGMSSAYA